MNDTCKSLKDNLLTSFDEIQAEISGEQILTVYCRKEAIIAILSYLKNSGYDHLALVSCVDWIQDKELELVYILSAYTENDAEGKINILVKTRIKRDRAEFFTIINIFENAEPFERELHELYGIYFKGHPRLTPLLLERKYTTPPFRKDFDTRKYVEEVF